MALIPQLRLWLSAYPGAKLFSYIAGSATKQNSYSDSALTTPNANPVVADSGGLFGSIYLDPALSYKFVLAPSTDTDPPTSPLYTQDNVTSSSAGTLTVLSKVASYAVASTDGGDVIILADATLGAITVSLYTAVGNSGAKVRVVKTDSSANTVTIDPSGTQTWAGSLTRVLGFQYQVTGGVSDGANWQEFEQANTGWAISSTGVVDWTGRIRTTNVGPHAVGLAVSTASQWKIGGTHAPTGANAQDNVYELTTTVTLETNASGAAMYINPTFTEAGSGTHAILAGIWIPQFTITNAAAAVTNAASLYIANAPSVTGGSAWAMWVAAGASRFDEDIVFGASKNIRANTTDGSDNVSVVLNAGGAGSDQTRSGFVSVFGNEHANTGQVRLTVGNVASSAVQFFNSAGTAMFAQLGSDGSSTFTTTAAQAFTVNSTAANGGDIYFQRSGTVYGRVGQSAAVGCGGANTDFGVWNPTGTGNLYLNAGSASGGKTFMSNVANDTTGSAANVFIVAGTGELQRSTSSARYKTDISLMNDADRRWLMDIAPITFRSKKDPKGKLFGGLLAEDVAVKAPMFAVFDADGLPDEVAYGHLTAPLIKAVQNINIRLEHLEHG